MTTKSQTHHYAIPLNKSISGDIYTGVADNDGFVSDKDILIPRPNIERIDLSTYNGFKPHIIIEYNGRTYLVGSDDSNKLVLLDADTLGVWKNSDDSSIGRISAWAVYNKKLYLGDTNGNIHELDLFGNLTVSKFNVTDKVVALLHNYLDDRLHIVTRKKIRYIDGSTLSADEFVITNTDTIVPVSAHLYTTANFAYIVVMVRRYYDKTVSLLFFDFDYSKTTWAKSVSINDDNVFAFGVVGGYIMSVSVNSFPQIHSKKSQRVFIKRYDGSKMKIVNSFDIAYTLIYFEEIGVVDSKLYFHMSSGMNDLLSKDEGVYSIDEYGNVRKIINPFANNEQILNFDTLYTLNIKSKFYYVVQTAYQIGTNVEYGDWFFRTNPNVGSAGYVYSIYEPNPFVFRYGLFQVTEVYVDYLKLKDDQKVIIYYKVDVDDNWVLLGETDINSDKYNNKRKFRRKFKLKNVPLTNRIWFRIVSENGIIIDKIGMFYKVIDYE